MISNINSFNNYYKSSSQSQIGAAVLKNSKFWSKQRPPKSLFGNSLVKHLGKNEENPQKHELINTIKQFSNKENIHKPTGQWFGVCGSTY